jgi:hypothetical protein
MDKPKVTKKKVVVSPYKSTNKKISPLDVDKFEKFRLFLKNKVFDVQQSNSLKAIFSQLITLPTIDATRKKEMIKTIKDITKEYKTFTEIYNIIFTNILLNDTITIEKIKEKEIFDSNLNTKFYPIFFRKIFKVDIDEDIESINYILNLPVSSS